MDSATFIFTSRARSSGDVNNYTIEFDWPYLYSVSRIKVLRVNVIPNRPSKAVYVTSDIIAGFDNGYIIPNTTFNNPIIAVCPPTNTANNIYVALLDDPSFVSEGSIFGARRIIPDPKRMLSFAIFYDDGSPVMTTEDWVIVIKCYFHIQEPIRVNS